MRFDPAAIGFGILALTPSQVSQGQSSTSQNAVSQTAASQTASSRTASSQTASTQTASTQTAQQKTRYIFSFGDSYTQTGFVPLGTKPTIGNAFGNPPYPGDTTSGGPNWIGDLVVNLSPPNTLSWNFAFGGATIDKTIVPTVPTVYDFVAQRNEFLLNVNSNTAQWNANNSVFMTYFGTNDINTLYGQLGSTGGTAAVLMSSYFALLQSLYDVGARRFVVFLMDPLERTPQYQTLMQLLIGVIKADVVNFNNLLSSSRDDFVRRNGDAQMALLDTQSVFNGILDNPLANGSPNNVCNNGDGTSCLWWNYLHPGQAIQRALAKEAFNVLTQAGFYD